MSRHQRLTIAAPREIEDRVVAELWAQATLGIEMRETAGGGLLLDAYFEDGAELWPAAWEVLGARTVGVEPLPPTDWMAAYRARARPFRVGRRWLIDPREPDGRVAAPPAGGNRRIRLFIPVQAAFGTGEHATTRSMLEVLEGLPVAGTRVLDWGTGTGILALAALRLGAAEACALDVDLEAVAIARHNARRHDVGLALLAGGLAALRAPERFDLALVNILPARIAAELARLPRLVAPGGMIVLSGLLAGGEAGSIARLVGLGCRVVGRRTLDGWCTLEVERLA
jgi:ribosomal protein L11 methyltransferase